MPTKEDSLLSHLIELRKRLMYSLVALGAVFLGLLPFSGKIYGLLARPMLTALPAGASMIATGVVAPFFIPMKVTMMAAFVITLPFLLYQAWRFIAPGLYAHEKKLVLPLTISSYLLFLLGMAFCYFIVFRTVFSFIVHFAPDSITLAPDIAEYLSFVMTMFLAFGLAFELPIVVVVLVRTGIVPLEVLQRSRSYVIVGAFIVAAVVTPPDVMSQLLLAIPLCILYEVGLLAARLVRKNPADQAQQ